MKKLFASMLCLWVVMSSLSGAAGFVAKWTNPEGVVIEAEFVEMTDTHVVLKLRNQSNPVRVEYAKLNDESLEQARRMQKEMKAKQAEFAAATAGKFKVGNEWVPRGKRTEVVVDIPGDAAREFLSKSYGKPTTKVKINVIVPEGFDPQDRDSLVVVCHAPHGNGRGLSVAAIPMFSKEALARNALVLAADGEFGNPGKEDLTPFRSFLLYSALNTLGVDHPTKAWRYVHVGSSGGCGYATSCAMYMITAGHRVPGCYLNVGNYSPLMWDNDYKLTASQKKELKLYYSFGRNDKVCPPHLAEEMLAKLKRSPYTNLRVHWHEMGHGIDQSQYAEALDWLFDLK